MLSRESEYSARFGDRHSYKPGLIFPFVHAFVPREEDTYDEDKDSAIQWIRDRTLGPTVAAGEDRAFYVRLAQDYNFYMKWIRYSVYKPKSLAIAEYRWYDPITNFLQIISGVNDDLTFEETGGIPIVASLTAGYYTPANLATHIQASLNAAGASTYTVTYVNNRFVLTSDGTGGGGIFNLLWTSALSPAHMIGFDNTADDTGSLSYTGDWDRVWMLDTYDYNAAKGNSYLRYLDVSVSFSAPQNQYLYGGANLNPIQNGATGIFPLPIKSVQGYEYGYGQLATPMLLPLEGNIRFQFFNRSAVDLIVSGCIGGVKVRL